MKTSYDVIVDGDKVTWITDRPQMAGPTRATISMLPEPIDGNVLADLCEEIVQRTGGIRSIDDPVAWQRDMRVDRPMPGREP